MKTVRLLLALVMSVGLFSVTPALAAEKSVDLYYLDDVDYDHWAYTELERFVYADIIDGYVTKETYEEDGETYEYVTNSIKPENSITRAQFTKILVNAMNLTAGDQVKSFSDVKSSDWYNQYVQIASSQGVITGKEDGTFRPNEKITRDQMAVMIYRAFKPSVDFSATGKTFNDVTEKSFAYEAVLKTSANGIIKGYGDVFKPRNFATRAQAIVMIDRALHQEAGTDEEKPTVTQLVDRYFNEELTLTQQKDLAGLEAMYRDTMTGYLLSTSLDQMGMLGEMEDFDGTFTMEKMGEHKTSVATMNKRFAEVRVDNLIYKVSMTSPDMSFDMNVNASGTAYLKKNADGNWKIYNFVMDEEDQGQDWEEQAVQAMN